MACLGSLRGPSRQLRVVAHQLSLRLVDIEVHTWVLILYILRKVVLPADLVRICGYRFGLTVPIVILNKIVGAHSA